MKPLGLGLMLLISFAFGLCLSGYSQVEVDVEFGFAGKYLPDRPAPLWVTIESRSPLQGRIIVSQEVRSPWRGTVEEEMVLPFALPGRGRKRFELAFLVRGYIYPLQVAVLAEPGDELIFRREIALKERAGEGPLTLALAGRGEPFPLELPTGERPVQLGPEDFPSSWVGLLGVGRLYLGRLDPKELSPAQWEALTRWVEWGGELVVLGGDNWYLQDSPRLRGLIPFIPVGVGELAGWPVVLGEPGPRSEVLYRRQGPALALPLLVAKRLGRGRVLFATVNPLAPAGPGLEEEAGFWAALERGPLRQVGDEERLRLGVEMLEQMLLPFPSKLALIGLYSLFVAGLALASWLAARQPWVRPLPLLWVAAIGALTFGYLGRPEFARPVLGLELGLSHDLGEVTLHSSWLSLFAKAGRGMALQAEHGDEGGYLCQVLPEERGERLYDVTYQGRLGLSASFKLADWQARSFFLERFSGDLARLRIVEGRARAENMSPYPLQDCWLIDEEGLYRLGWLGPGETKEWEPGPGLLSLKGRPATWERLYELARAELLGPRGLLCIWAAPGEFSQTALEARTTLRLALIEEDR